MDMQRDSLSNEEAQKYYDQYKADQNKRQAEVFYETHKHESWFKEKYDPEQIYFWKQDRYKTANSLAQKFIEEFVDEVDNKKASTLCFDEKEGHDYQRLISLDNDEVAKAPLFGFDANAKTLYLKQIPVRVGRLELLNEVKNSKGFASFSMSDPLKAQDFERYAWVSYETEEDCAKARDQLDGLKIKDFKLYPIRSQTQRKPIRITPPLPDNIDNDFKLCKQLIQKVFDVEKGIPSSLTDKLLEFANLLESPQKLDLLLLYLRRVHAFCFYCGEEYEDERMLSAKCGPQHIRAAQKLSKEDLENTDKWQGSKSFEEKYIRAIN